MKPNKNTLKANDIKLVIFDLDGTLINAYPAIIESFNFSMKQLNYPVKSATIIKKAVGWGDRNLLKPFVKINDLSKILKIYRCHHKTSLLKGSSLIPGARRVLNFLKANKYVLAVASNRPSRFSHILIRHLNIRQYFDYILCADKLKQGKPNPAILFKIMRRFRVLPCQTIYVGDMFIDAQTGKRAQVKTIIVTTGSSTKAEVKKESPYRIIRSILQLPASLKTVKSSCLV